MEGFLKLKQESIFQNKSFMLLLMGQIVSNLGNAVHSVAVSWFIMNTVGKELSGTYMGIFGACVLIPYIICGPLSGVYVDRISRKKIIVGTDLIRGSLIVLLGGLVYLNIYPMISLFTITFLSALFGSFFNPAVDASIPNIVAEKDLTQANSLNGMSRQLTWIIGGAISGFLYYKLGIIGIFLVNGISFILSGISETFIKLPHVKKESNESSSFWSDFKGGVKYVKNQKTLMRVMVFSLVLNFIYSPIFQIVFPKTLKFTLDMGAREYGILQSLFPVGAMLGMVALSSFKVLQDNHRVVKLAILIQSIFFIGFGIPIISTMLDHLGNSNVYILYCILAVLLMICNAFINIPFFTALQKKVPDEYRGRFFGLLNTLSQGIVPIGLGFYGFISDLVLPSVIFIGSGIVALLMGVWIIGTTDFKEIL
ncbi:MFS transporter [Alkaliphilus hydrothermalis]|uniref:MFS family permease n=1 Tax=Alkaliphilus hydrothermalis TaxID=1482730 RepID=A0ABS2NR84_9FIRM|nr:MFS transporter [Alkaliphilus hydrothermalis]MBM7615469.1 MFS family permease [Alkaliphilus hydrothermalis]